jgi:dynein heavy chain
VLQDPSLTCKIAYFAHPWAVCRAIFEEFNCIDVKVLAVVSQNVLTLQRAKAAKLTRFDFKGTILSLRPKFGMSKAYSTKTDLNDRM